MNFGIGITFWEDKNTQRVLEMTVNSVRPDSGAEFEGLTPGTRIWTINGVPVDNFEASLETGAELNKIFINRKRGDQVTLEVAQPGHRGTRFVTLTEDSGMKIILLPRGGSNRDDGPEKAGPFQLNQKRKLAFGLGLNFWTKGSTRKVAAIYVSEVWPQSGAASQGLQEGTRIYSINGKAVDEFSGDFEAGTDLNRIFLHRRSGDRVTLEISTQRLGERKFVTLVE